ncbi:MAG TPA: ATP-dependent DNA helicase UvrD2 [Candidatus Deferrimicrobium sp.]|nr:ATP-dependent DNA helicase UvrD2 [Candidatus Deferrimicrobium sp.]
MIDLERILTGLNDAQREAVTTVSGPLAIVAGAGSGKTRVVSHRAAYAVATGVVPERQILLVTFTEKAASEMAERVRGLGLARVTARTFHSAALAQLRYFWPTRHEGAPLPEVMADKWRIVSPLARALPGGYRFTPSKDLMDEIEWAKSRRLTPPMYEHGSGDRQPPIPMNLFVRLFRDYERGKGRRGLIDFDDILGLTVDLLEADEQAAQTVRSRYSWFTVDEYQDTTPLQARLLELWLGDRRDLCVVGDEDQTIYTFAGATPEHLRGFTARHPGARVIDLLENYRSSPQVLSLANRLLASAGVAKRLVATVPDGPEPTIRTAGDGEAEVAFIVERARELLADGVPAREIAVLVRLNAQVESFEAAFTRAGIPYQVRGQRFFERREVRTAVRALERLPEELVGENLVAAAREAWRDRLGFDPDEEPEGREARERHAALSTLLAIVTELAGPMAGGSPGGEGRHAVLAELAGRAEGEAQGDADGVELLTLHRAKGLEWDAVFIPSLEEGLLPVSQAGDDEDALAEERRLLYVGITRARRHLALSWARQRLSAAGRPQTRTMSRFLRSLGGSSGRISSGRGHGSGGARVVRSAGGHPSTTAPDGADAALLEVLKAWRRQRSAEDDVPAYVVATDATLAAIAERRPASEAELLSVPGIGPAKVAKYAEAILAVVRGRA